jgi:hypothetical protein
MLVLFSGFLVATGFAAEKLIPWKFGGYQNVKEFHLKYLSLSTETLRDFENIKKGTLKTEINELWFRQDPPMIRIDKYIEEGTIQCNQFKNREWEKITHEGKTYVLSERTIQLDSERTHYYLENISSGGGMELCEYKTFEGTKDKPTSLRDVLLLLTVVPHISELDDEEMISSSLEMDKLLNPDKFKKMTGELQIKHEKAGRSTCKWETGHGLIHFPAQGYAFIDLEWGIGIEGHLTGQRGGGGFEAIEFEKPVCIYKALKIAAKISDPDVFEKWME